MEKFDEYDEDFNIFDTIDDEFDDFDEASGAESEETPEPQKTLINHREELTEAMLKLQGFYQFDKNLKIDMKTRLMSIYMIGQDKINCFMNKKAHFFDIRYKHIGFCLKESYVNVNGSYQKALVFDDVYQLFDDKGTFLRFEATK